MTRRRKRLLGIVAGVAVLGTLALPPVHSRLIVWLRGEPFWEGMSASYYAEQISRAWRVRSSAEVWVRNKLPAGVADAVWGKPETWRALHVKLSDPANLEALPVLMALAESPDPKVRWLSVSLSPLC